MSEQRWIKPRHRIVQEVARIILTPYIRLKYRVRVRPLPRGSKGPYLVLYNHQTAYDQFFVGMAVPRPIYYLATEDIFSLGWLSRLLCWAVAPIPIKKQTMDIQAVKTCLRVAREGGTLAIAPEGNRTYSGKTAYINPSIASLAKKLGLPILLCRIEGGYGVHPRWSDAVRRGRMRCYIAETITPEEYGAMTKEELARRITEGLYVNEAADEQYFRHPKRAEYLERMLYLCPRCGMSTFRSHGHTVTCQRCGLSVEYGEDTRLRSADGDFPFAFAADWYAYQEETVNRLDVTLHRDAPLWQEQADLYRVLLYRKKVPVSKNVTLSLYGDRLVIRRPDGGEQVFPFDTTDAITVLGKNKLNLYADDTVYQIKGDARFNALKYVHLYHRCKHILRGDLHNEFLGL